MDERRDKLYFHWSDSQQKFDHVVVGILAAWFAFLLQNFRPTSLSINPLNASAVETMALLLVLSALTAGILKIEAAINVIRFQAEQMACKRNREALDNRRPGAPLISQATGEHIDEDGIREFASRVAKDLASATTGLKRSMKRGRVYYHIRNLGALAGALTLVAARLMNAQ